MALLAFSFQAQAGTLTPPSPIAPSMYSLSDIYNRLITNIAATSGNHSLSTTTAPAGTFRTLTEIYDAIPTIIPGDFLASSTYFGVTGSIFVHTGNTTASSSATSTHMVVLTPPPGYYDGAASVSTTSASLDAANVKSGVSLFGLAGTFTGGPAPANKRPLKTGQTTCYDNSGSPIPCAGTGQDGDLQTGTVRSYTDNGNGTITDNSTGLQWQKCDVGLSGADCAAGSTSTLTWTQATTTCDSMVLGGHSDWKVPNMNELLSLVDFGTSSPAIDSAFFPNTALDYHWSSTPLRFNRPGAWDVTFNDGETNYDDPSTLRYVRCVRVNAVPASSAPAEPVKTGAVACFSPNYNGNQSDEVPCAGSGEDGEYQAGADRGYVNNGDGTITDEATGLMWQRCGTQYTGTFCDDLNGTAPPTSWLAIFSVCASQTTGGHSDWRAPTMNELMSLTDYANTGWDFDPTYFRDRFSYDDDAGTQYVQWPGRPWTITAGSANQSGGFTGAGSFSGEMIRCVRN